jgi:tetratricopeptide (TPR) repeat protein
LTAKRYRIIAFCIIWFFANVAIEALAADLELMFEHRAYLSSTLFFVPFLWLAFRRLNKPLIVVPFVIAWIGVLSFWTMQRNALWNDPVAFWQDAVSKSPNHYRAHANLGISLLQTKDYELARKSFEMALTLSPPHPTEIYTNLGLAQVQLGELDAARKNLEKAVALNQNNYAAFDLLGNLYRKQKNFARAMEYYEAAIDVGGDFASSSHYNQGMLYKEMGKPTEAMKALERALTLKPMWAEAYSSLGLIQAELGRFDLAEQTLVKATAIDANNEEALFNLARVYQLKGDYRQAENTYRRLLRIKPDDVEALHNLGMIYWDRLKDPGQAVTYLRMALSIDPNHDQAATARDVLARAKGKR